MADLITTADYKDYKGIDHFKDDDKINSLVPSVSQLVKTYCGTSFVDYFSSGMTEKFDIMDTGTQELFLTESPLVTVTSVKEREGIARAYTTLTNNTDYYVDAEHDRIYRIDGDKSVKSWATGFSAVEVIYTAGYSSTPQDLRLAIYDLITYYLKEEYKGRKSLAGASLQNETATSITGDIGFPDHIKRILDMHRIVDVV